MNNTDLVVDSEIITLQKSCMLVTSLEDRERLPPRREEESMSADAVANRAEMRRKVCIIDLNMVDI